MQGLPHRQRLCWAYICYLRRHVTITKPTADTRGRSERCTFCGFGQISNDVYSPIWYHTEWFHGPESPPCSVHPILPAPCRPPTQSLTPTGLLTVSMVLPFPECHRVGIVQYYRLFRLTSFLKMFFILLFCFVLFLAGPCAMKDVSPLAGHRTWVLCIGSTVS